MSRQSAIEWTDATWNPWRGCTKVSAGCDNCYMFREQARYGRDPAVVVRSKTTFDAPLKWHDPRFIFTCSWADWFHEDADEWRPAAWKIIEATPQHTYLILTKRTGRVRRHLPWGVLDHAWSNVWLGTSIENQATSFRVRHLRALPAAVRFLSCEPLLGPVDVDLQDIGWVIVGGESGPQCRPMELDWARQLRDNALHEGAKFFLKQLGGWPDKRGHEQAILDGVRWTERPVVPGSAPTEGKV